MIKPPTKLLQKLYDAYSNDTAKFLIHTASVSWGLASIANIIGISTNKKLDSKEKKYLIPQEIADGVTNIGLFYLVTQSLTKGVKKLVDNGKIVFKNVEKGTSEFRNARNGLGVVTSVVGAVISSNILTPIVRGQYAAHKQKQVLKMEQENVIPNRSLPYFKQNLINPMPMSSFLAFTRNPNLKI